MASEEDARGHQVRQGLCGAGTRFMRIVFARVFIEQNPSRSPKVASVPEKGTAR
jgi:hypothetical protein